MTVVNLWVVTKKCYYSNTSKIIFFDSTLGIDKHFIKRAGALGGLKRTETKEQSMRNYLNQLPENVTGKDISKKKLRDEAKIDADDAIKATGGHELIPCDQLADLLAKGILF